MKLGETVESACRREVMEATGIEVTEISLVGVYSDKIEHDPGRPHYVLTETGSRPMPWNWLIGSTSAHSR